MDASTKFEMDVYTKQRMHERLNSLIESRNLQVKSARKEDNGSEEDSTKIFFLDAMIRDYKGILNLMNFLENRSK